MADYAHKKTDAMLDELELNVRREYARAEKEIQSKLNKYLIKFERDRDEQIKLLREGKITRQDYNDWMTRKIGMGKRWEEMRDNLAQDMTNAGQIARSIADGYKPEVYALNHNWATYQIEHDGKIDTFYQLYDRQTVERLMEKDRKLMPPAGKKVKREIALGKAQKWNNKQLQSALTQSILQGESIPDMAKRVARTVATRSYADSVRYARTMITGAESAGRQDAYERAENMGIDLEKEWIATLDDRTRHTHRQLHGERRPLDEEFSNGCMFPADPSGDDEEVYNCRCTTKAAIKGFEGDRVESSPKMGGMSFEEWQGAKAPKEKEPEPEVVREPFKNDKLEKAMGNDWIPFRDIVDGSDNKHLYDSYADRVGRLTIGRGGTFRPATFSIEASYKNIDGASKYSTIAHEYGHMFDACGGKLDGLGFSEVDMINEKCREKLYIKSWDIVKPLPSSSDEFMTALRKDMEALKPKIADGTIRNTLIKDYATRNSTSGVQDALDGFYSTQKNNILPWGHGDAYYNRAYNQKVKGMGVEKELKEALQGLGMDASNQTKVKRIMRQYEASSEAWANVSSAVTCGGAELEAVEKYMPETVKAYRGIIGKMGKK